MRPNWKKIRYDYITSTKSYRDMASEYGVSFNTLAKTRIFNRTFVLTFSFPVEKRRKSSYTANRIGIQTAKTSPPTDEVTEHKSKK